MSAINKKVLLLTNSSQPVSASQNDIGTERSIDVNMKHVINHQFNRHFMFFTGSIDTVTSASAVGATSLAVVFPTVVNSGDRIFITDGNTQEPDRLKVTEVGSPFLILDRPLDNAYTIGAQIEVVGVDLTASSSLATVTNPISFKIAPSSGTNIHIARLNVEMADGSTMDDGKFGGAPALKNGVVIRKCVNGVFSTLTNWKENGDMAEDMFDVDYTAKAPAGENGLRGRWSYSRFEVFHVLCGENGDFMEALVQDNLTAVTNMELKVQGH